MARLLFSGHLTRYPGVNLVISHGGAALPYALGRFKRNNAIHKGEYADAEESFRRLYFDTVLFETRALRFLCDVAGTEKVVLGSDYPFPIGDMEPVKIVDGVDFSAHGAQRYSLPHRREAVLYRLRLQRVFSVLSNRDLPVHFFTHRSEWAALYRISYGDVLRRLPFRWHWHIVEGVADLVHDTGWSLGYGAQHRR